MKMRNGFVSNSSSSSYICEICNEIESGYGIGPSDLGMEYCENGHYYHTSCLHNKDIKEKVEELFKLKEQEEKNEDNDYDEVPSKYCPVCQMIVISDSLVLRHILETANLDINKVKDEMRKKFAKNKENKNENT